MELMNKNTPLSICNFYIYKCVDGDGDYLVLKWSCKVFRYFMYIIIVVSI